MRKNKPFLTRIFHNNKFLLVLSVVLAIAFWAAVKVNYSDNSTRTISDVKVTLDTARAEENDFTAYYNEDDLLVDIVVSGKSFNINSYALTRDDIVIDASFGYVDAAGNKTINLTPRINSTDVEIVRITPSTLTIFFDRAKREELNVEARLTNEQESLVADGYVVGQPVPSFNTVTVSGPASIVDQLSKVYFNATIDKKALPLTATQEVPATLSYDLQSKRNAGYLTCESINSDTNPPTVTIPVNKVATVDTAVKFINQPDVFVDTPPKVTISPRTVSIIYNDAEESYDTFNVGTIDFKTLENKVNTFKLQADEKSAALLESAKENNFEVKVDFSAYQKQEIDASTSSVVLLNQSKNYKYEVDADAVDLRSVTVIGPAESLATLTAENLQIEINVSALDVNGGRRQSVPVSNISIQSDTVKDCWVFGDYKVNIRVREKN